MPRETWVYMSRLAYPVGAIVKSPTVVEWAVGSVVAAWCIFFFVRGRWERHDLHFLCEYGIGCHNKERVRRLEEMGYPNLADKRTSLRLAPRG